MTEAARARQVREFEFIAEARRTQESARRREFASDHNFVGATPLTLREVQDVQVRLNVFHASL